MKTTLRTALLTAVIVIAANGSPTAMADERITCESRDNQYQHCPINRAGHVTMVRQTSSSPCRQGRTWDYDRRGVWVDDGCRAEFNVNTYDSNKGKSSGNDGAKVAAGVIIGAAILGAMAHNSNKDKSRYSDDNYYGSRHSSYVPGWMVGSFRGYNPVYDADVRMSISADGQVNAVANGQRIDGWINNGEMHVGDNIFTISQNRDGFTTSQVGDSENRVHYRRSR